jgi:hypothetical protein
VADPSARAQLEARYVNCFEAGYNDVEFVVDFGQQYGSGAPLYHTRIVTSAPYLRELLDLLTRTYGEYEAAHHDRCGGPR